MRLHPTASFGNTAAVMLAAATFSVSACAAESAVEAIVALLTNDDAEFRAIGLEGVRRAVEGAAATQRFAGMLADLPRGRKIELLRALADRGDAAAVPAVTAVAARSPDAAVRAAAVAALGTLGGGADVAVLLRYLAFGEPERTAARRALVEIRGADAERRIVAAAKSSDPALRPMLIDALTSRRARSALSDLVAMTCVADPAVRAAAMRACGEFGGPEEVPGMIAGLLASAPGDERRQAERAVVAVCTKGCGHEEAEKVFVETFTSSAESQRESLLPVLGGIGSPAALAIINDLMTSDAAAERRMGLEAISRWPDATVAPRLLELAGKSKDPAERDLLVGALIRIAPLPDNKLDNSQKLDLVKKTMSLCQNDEERVRLLDRVNAIRTMEAFRYLTGFLDTPTLAEPACRSVVELAHHRQLRDAHKDEVVNALDKVIGTSKNAELVARAQAYKAGKTWERKKS